MNARKKQELLSLLKQYNSNKRLNEANVKLTKQGSNILKLIKKSFKQNKKYPKQKVYDYQETIYDNKPVIIIYTYADSNSGVMYDSYRNLESQGYRYTIPLRSEKFKNPHQGVYYNKPSKDFSSGITIRYNAVIVYYKNTVNLNALYDIILKKGFSPSIYENQINVQFQTNGEAKQLIEIGNSFKNVKISTDGGYFADSDNKHFSPVATFIVK